MTRATATRFDLHRPSSPLFDPEAYDCYGVFDTDAMMDQRARMQEVDALHVRGYHLGAGSSNQCGHCGTRIRYAALMVRSQINEYIYVGETCLDERFEALTAQQFQFLRQTARLNRERMNRIERIARLVDDHPVLADLTYPEYLSTFASTFVIDVARRFREDGNLSERQIASVKRAVIQDAARHEAQISRQAEWDRERDAAAPVPTGRVNIEATVISTSSVPGYGYNAIPIKKITVKSADGWKVYLTCPESIIDVTRGQSIRVTVTITAAEDDPKFGRGKRPANATIIA